MVGFLPSQHRNLWPIPFYAAGALLLIFLAQVAVLFSQLIAKSSLLLWFVIFMIALFSGILLSRFRQ